MDRYPPLPAHEQIEQRERGLAKRFIKQSHKAGEGSLEQLLDLWENGRKAVDGKGSLPAHGPDSRQRIEHAIDTIRRERVAEAQRLATVF